jgi:hypothetical protein
MRVAVIRGDLSKALFLADLEPKSLANAPVESPLGQNRYISRPDPTRIAAYFTAQGLSASASGLITATVPVDGPVDVSSATIKGVSGLGSATDAQVLALQDLLSYRVIETDAAKKSFLYGNLLGFRSSSFNPDPRREPALANKAAISCVADDGSTLFVFAAPVVTTADRDTPGAGALRITGTSMAAYGMYEVTVIIQGTSARRITQRDILNAGGSLTGTQIDIPASLVPGVALTSSLARVQVNDMLSNATALT